MTATQTTETDPGQQPDDLGEQSEDAPKDRSAYRQSATRGGSPPATAAVEGRRNRSRRENPHTIPADGLRERKTRMDQRGTSDRHPDAENCEREAENRSRWPPAVWAPCWLPQESEKTG